jgi:hypothetical protein
LGVSDRVVGGDRGARGFLFHSNFFKERGPLMRHLMKGLAAGLILAQMSGCVFLVAGTIGAVGGYAVTRDTIQGEYDARASSAFRGAVAVCEILGVVTQKDAGTGVLDAVIDGAKVNVTITQLTPSALRLRVKARKGLFPRMATAEKVFTKIVQKLK